MRSSFFKRAKRAVRREFRRIKDQHRSTRIRRKKPPLSRRIKYRFKKLREEGFRSFFKRPSRPKYPSNTKKLRNYLRSKREEFSVIFSRKYLIITLNSTVLYLLAFFLIHFLTHLVTGITAYFCDISTTLYYTLVDFHIRYYNWTEEMVIMVFSIPAIFALIIAIVSSLAFERQKKNLNILKRFRVLTRLQRRKQREKKRRKEKEMQQSGAIQPSVPQKRLKRKKRIPWKIRLFLLWILYHSTTYFFSGMLFSFLFHRRFGYVIWYAFNSYIFDIFFTLTAFVSLIIIGYLFASQFFYSGRLYFNDLTGRNRMPFVISQAIFPFIIGTILTIVLQIPEFSPTLLLLNFSIFLLLLPLPSRAVRFDNIHFDSLEKKIKIQWKWLAGSLVVMLAIIVALKTGITIHLP
jgi:hypothetical protein